MPTPTLPLTPDQLLTTTRSVRKRLDFSRPVEPEIIRECLEIALQAPNGGNRQPWSFVIVTDAAKRQALGDIYRRGWAVYKGLPINAPDRLSRDPARAATQLRILEFRRLSRRAYARGARAADSLPQGTIRQPAHPGAVGRVGIDPARHVELYAGGARAGAGHLADDGASLLRAGCRRCPWYPV